MTATVEAVVAAAASTFGVALAEIAGPARPGDLALARQSAMWLAASLTSASYGTIGEALGGRDRTTVRHGVAAVEKRLRRVRKGVATAEDRALATRLDGIATTFRLEEVA